MTHRSLVSVLALLLAGSGSGSGDPAPAAGPCVRYRIAHLPSLGGTSSVGNSINDRGWVAGRSNLPGNQTRHATLWRAGGVLDLGTLGGPNSNVAWPVKNTRGVLAGIAQTSEPDPLHEAWSCSAFFPAATGRGWQCLGFVWEDGAMRALPTLGGTHGFATGANNRGQVVGWAENTVPDPTCVPPQVLQFRAVVWGPGDGEIQELPPLAGDSVSAATALNDRGRVVGISGICDDAVGKFSASHAVRWDHGVPTDLGNIGGLAWNTSMAVNQRGDIAGFGNVSVTPAGEFNGHAFLWTERGGIRDLGTLPGDVLSQAFGLNERRQVVGRSCGAAFNNCRAFLWEDGRMTELVSLAPGYTGVLTLAGDIDDQGWITGQARDPQTNNLVAFLATPVHH
jgi:probable HAF family extracellular repeat protein